MSALALFSRVHALAGRMVNTLPSTLVRRLAAGG